MGPREPARCQDVATEARRGRVSLWNRRSLASTRSVRPSRRRWWARRWARRTSDRIWLARGTPRADMTAMTTSTDRPELMDLMFAALDHAVKLFDRRCRWADDPIRPMRRGDKAELHRFVAATVEKKIEHAREFIKHVGPEITQVALAYDGYVTVDDVRTDAVLIDVQAAGTPTSGASSRSATSSRRRDAGGDRQRQAHRNQGARPCSERLGRCRRRRRRRTRSRRELVPDPAAPDPRPHGPGAGGSLRSYPAAGEAQRVRTVARALSRSPSPPGPRVRRTGAGPPASPVAERVHRRLDTAGLH